MNKTIAAASLFALAAAQPSFASLPRGDEKPDRELTPAQRACLSPTMPISFGGKLYWSDGNTLNITEAPLIGVVVAGDYFSTMSTYSCKTILDRNFR